LAASTFCFKIESSPVTSDGESVEAYLAAAYAVFFSYVHHKLVEHTAAQDDNLELSKFNSVNIKIRKEEITKFREKTEALLKKYTAGDGDSYQLTTFLVPDVNGGKYYGITFFKFCRCLFSRSST
jgi:hypothetical protein